MERMYVIAWKARTGERTGRGKKLMGRQEAETLATELNRDYPEFEHEAVPAESDPVLTTEPQTSAAAPEGAEMAAGEPAAG